MRKYLYRAFKKDSTTQTLCGSSQIKLNGETYRGEWVYGYLSSSHHIDEYEEKVFDGITIEVFKERHVALPKTICEFTDLTDKNGNKIFEGDIVQGEAEEARGVVEWQQAECRYLVSVRNGYDWLCMDDDKWTAIGNIYDNPELLE